MGIQKKVDAVANVESGCFEKVIDKKVVEYYSIGNEMVVGCFETEMETH